MDIDAYSIILTVARLGRRVGGGGLFLKIEKGFLILEKETLIVCIFDFPFKM